MRSLPGLETFSHKFSVHAFNKVLTSDKFELAGLNLLRIMVN